MEVGTSELPEQIDHHTAADNQGVVMNEIEPSVSERRPSSDTSGMLYSRRPLQYSMLGLILIVDNNLECQLGLGVLSDCPYFVMQDKG